MSRILLWSSSFWPHIGGVEVLGANYVEALTARGHEVTVVARRDTDDLPDEGEVAGVRVVRRPFRQVIERRDAAGTHALRREMTALKRELDPDVVHLYHLGPDLLFHRLTADAVRAPVVVTLHQSFDDAFVARGQALGRTLQHADWIAACSQAVHDRLLVQLPDVAGRSEVVANALPPSTLSADPIPDGPPVVLFVGRVVPQKGFDIGLRAFALVREAQPQVRLVVAGDGVELPALQALAAELGIAEAIRWVGWADPSEIRELMRAATVVVMPSRFEPFGLVALEAAEMRRPVVATAVEGLCEAVVADETGLLVQPGDVEELASAVTRVLDDRSLAQRLGDGGRARAQPQEGWDRYVTAYETIYERVADG